MTISIRQIHPVFVGEASGIDITQPLSRDEVAAIEAGMDRYAVMHRVRRWGERRPRDMRRRTVAGDAPTTAQVHAE